MENKISIFLTIVLTALLLFASNRAYNPYAFNEFFYESAVFNAMYPHNGAVDTNLTPIVESNNNLSWSGVGADKRVLMVVWTKYPSSYPVGQTVNTTWGDTWASVYPQLKNYFTNNTRPNEDLRLQIAQLLGMPPNSNDTYFVEVWVRPDDLFRPSADNEINDTVAQLSFPPHTDPAYKKWFLNNTIYSYFNKRLPGTRLGYTYHWDNPSKFGLSEYVIRENSEVIVKSLASTADYLSQ